MFDPEDPNLVWLANEMYTRTVKNNRNCLMFYNGAPGSGKSTSSLGTMYHFDIKGNFSLENCVFSSESWFKNLQGKTWPKGSNIVYEELGNSMNARRALSEDNLKFSRVMQTFRTRNYNAAFNVPDVIMVDSQARLLYHIDVFCDGWNPRTKYNIIVPKIKYKFNGKTNWCRPKRTTQWGDECFISELNIPPPPNKLMHAYEKLRDEFTDQVINENRIYSDVEIIEVISKDPESYMTRRGALDFWRIRNEFGVGDTVIRRVNQGLRSTLDKLVKERG